MRLSIHFVAITLSFILGVGMLGLLDADKSALTNLFSMLMGYVFGALSERVHQAPTRGTTENANNSSKRRGVQ